MGVHPLAVVGHVGPDFSGAARDEPHALSALAALGQSTRLAIFRRLVRKEPHGMTAGALAREHRQPAAQAALAGGTSTVMVGPPGRHHAAHCVS